MLKDYLIQILQSEEKATRAVEKFGFYRDLLIEWNQKFNLTAITDSAEIDLKHFIDSLLALPYVRGSVLDVGAGAGFPSLPLKIVLEETEFTLIDSLNKRVNFINEVIHKLTLRKITVLHARAEDLPKTKKYDTVVARAVAPLNVLSEYTLPFVKKGGLFIAYKAQDVEDEITNAKGAIRTLGGKIQSVKDVPLYGTDIVRKLILIEKINDTPPLYPRGKNEPRKNPLS